MTSRSKKESLLSQAQKQFRLGRDFTNYFTTLDVVLLKNMKIAVSSTGKNLESRVTDVFGRCPYFLVVEIDNKKIKGVEVIENTSINQTVGAGISAAKIIAKKDVDAIITGAVGPRALDVLKQFNIQVYNGFGPIKEAIQKFIDGELKQPK